jgi:hypothetical protein
MAWDGTANSSERAVPDWLAFALPLAQACQGEGHEIRSRT